MEIIVMWQGNILRYVNYWLGDRRMPISRLKHKVRNRRWLSRVH